MAGEPLVLLGLREGRVLAPDALAGPGRDAAHPDAARLVRPRRLLQPRLLAARPRRDRGLRRRALGERALPEARRGRAPRRARGKRRGPDEGGLRAARAGVAGPLPGARASSAARSSASAPRRARAASTDFRAGNLNQMLWLFLRLLASREAITDTLARVDRRQLEAGIANLKTRLAAAGDPDGPLARSLKATLEIQEKRLANLDTATNNLAVIDAELERIEQQVRLVREESAIVGSPEALSARLDSVSATLSETSRWMDQHAELFTDMATADLDAGTVPSLPRAPEEPGDEEAAPRRPPATRGPEAAMSERVPSGVGGGDAPGLQGRRHEPVRPPRQRLRPRAGAGRQGRHRLRLARRLPDRDDVPAVRRRDPVRPRPGRADRAAGPDAAGRVQGRRGGPGAS